MPHDLTFIPKLIAGSAGVMFTGVGLYYYLRIAFRLRSNNLFIGKVIRLEGRESNPFPIIQFTDDKCAVREVRGLITNTSTTIGRQMVVCVSKSDDTALTFSCGMLLFLLPFLVIGIVCLTLVLIPAFQ